MTRGELQAAPEEFLCPACGYDLRAISSDNCPECGVGVDRSAVGAPQIPWEHRRHLGIWRAYWRTNLRIIRHPSSLLAGLHPAIDRSAGRSFRRLTVLFGWLPVAAWFIEIGLTSEEASRFSGAGLLGWCLEAACYASVIVALYVALARIAASGFLYFQPKDSPEQRDIIATVSFYCCAPLAWTGLPAVLLLLAVLAEKAAPSGPLSLLPAALYRLSELVALAVFGAWVWCAFTLARFTLKFSRAQSIFLMLAIPFLWVAPASIALLIPLITFYISVVILSLS